MGPLLLNSLKGSLNVITGCGSGLGKATLQWFLRRGSGPILGIDRHFERDFVQSLELDEEQQKKLLLKQHDTFDTEKTEASLKEFVSQHGTIHNLVNVAGVSLAFTMYTTGRLSSYELRHAKDLSEFNTVGTFNMIRLASRYMIDNKKSSAQEDTRSRCIINTSCISTTKPSIGQSFYAGSKAALDSLTLCTARELSAFNIRCNTINVGYFDTKLLRSSEEKVCQYIVSEIMLCPSRLGHPDEFAHLTQAIIENSMINGACIKLDACAEVVLDKQHHRSLK